MSDRSALCRAWQLYQRFDADMAEDPAMCKPALSKPTQRVTRVINQGDTLAVDFGETQTMETAVIGK